MDESVKEPPESPAPWCTPGSPILPRPLREYWSAVPLPGWIVSELGIPEGATVEALDGRVTSRGFAISARVKNFALWLVRTNLHQVSDLRLFPEGWPTGFQFADLPFQRRTFNAVRNRRLDSDLGKFAKLTYGEASKLRNLGPVGLLDLSCTVESVQPSGLSTSIFVRTIQHSLALHSHVASATAEVNPIASGEHENYEALKRELERESLFSEDWSELISGLDPRFQTLLPNRPESLSELLYEDDGSLPSDADGLSSLAEQLSQRVLDLQSQNLETGAMSILMSLLKSRNPDDKRLGAIASRLNWNGRAEAEKLEAAGASVGLTRERIRQLSQKALERVPSNAMYFPALAKALQTLERSAPIAADDAAGLLLESGLSLTTFHPASVIALANALHHPHSLVLEHVGEGVVVTSKGNRLRVADVQNAAHRLLAVYGVISIDLLVSHLASELPESPPSLDEVRDALLTVASPNFINYGSGEWFWLSAQRRNPIASLARQLLAVTSALSSGTIREAFRRTSTFRATSRRPPRWPIILPPSRVLDSYFAASEEFVFTDGLVQSALPLGAMSNYLSPTELTMVEIIRTQPGQCIERTSLLREAVYRGLNANTVNQYMSYCPVLESLGRGYWTVRGTRVDPTTVEALREGQERRSRRTVGNGWTSDGKLWFGVRLPDLSVTPSLMVGVPIAIRGYLSRDRYAAYSTDGSLAGTIALYGDHMSGLVPYLRRIGAEENDIVVMEFDLATGEAIVSLDSEDEFETRIGGR